MKRRVDRLRSTGVIKGFTAIVDPAAIGWTTEAFVELFCTGQTTPAQIARRRPAPPGGGRGLHDLRRGRRAGAPARGRHPASGQALERLRSEPFITSTRSMIVLSRLVTGHLG